MQFIKIRVNLPEAYVTLDDYGYHLYTLFGLLAPENCSIIWLSNLFSVPDEGYNKNASCSLN